MKKVSMLVVATLILSGSALPALAANEKGIFRKDMKEARKGWFGQQKQENKEIRKDLKDLPKEQRLPAIQEQRQKQFAENKAFIESQHAKKMAELESRLAQNTKLTAEQKAAIKAQANTNFQENMAFRDKQFTETQAYVSKIASDTTLTPEQRRSALESYRQQQIKTAQERFQGQRGENKDLRSSMKAK